MKHKKPNKTSKALVSSFCALIFLLTIASFLLHRLAAEQSKIKIGAIVPLSGSLAVIGTATRNGIELAREQDPELMGNLEFIYRDTQSKTANVTTIYRGLLAKDSVSMIFAFNSATAHALGPLAEKDRVPFMSFAFESAPAKGKSFMIRAFNPSEQYIRALLKHLRASPKDQGNYYIITSQFSFIESMVGAFRDYLLEDEKIHLFADLPPSETDFRSILTRIGSNPPARIGVFLLPHQIAAFLKQAHDLGLNFEAYGTDFF